MKVAPELARVRPEWPLVVIGATAALFAGMGHHWLAEEAETVKGALMFAWLFVVIIFGAMQVVRHADCLAELLGEPYGTMILTLSVASIEILTIAVVMTSGDPNPTLARDTMAGDQPFDLRSSATWMTSGVLPLPPTVRLPITTTGTPALRLGARRSA